MAKDNQEIIGQQLPLPNYTGVMNCWPPVSQSMVTFVYAVEMLNKE